VSKRGPCAACGAKRTCGKTTFMVDRPGHRGEYWICNACWNDGENNEAWDERITKRIIERRELATIATSVTK